MGYKLTDRDLKILAEIETDGCRSVKDICRALHMKEPALRYHLRKLNSLGLTRLLPRINFKALGYQRYRVLLALGADAVFSSKKALEALLPHVFAARVSELSGEYEYSISLVVENEDALRMGLATLSEKFKGNVKDKRVLKIEEERFLGRSYLFGARVSQKPVLESTTVVSLDEKEMRILYLLFNCPYRARSEIAKALSIAPSSLEYKIAKLEKLGVIQRWYIEVNAQALGVQKYQMLLSLSSLSHLKRECILEKLSALPHIVQYHKLISCYDISLTIETHTASEFLDLRARVASLLNADLSSVSTLQILSDTDYYSLLGTGIEAERKAA